ncbi:Protein of unknown function [Pyronema omphalodes CBS 100304]|uniref:Uncharacterized protein n=1 Tax=Pyronema omphalodes (strain CBS 100304) TaxID=1076935 RepID=U4LUQ4_PYROM|nr:Protein of unknown function [Pyronema omphalodes CBS 100304]
MSRSTVKLNIPFHHLYGFGSACSQLQHVEQLGRSYDFKSSAPKNTRRVHQTILICFTHRLARNSTPCGSS